jgi:hypothetical protein
MPDIATCRPALRRAADGHAGFGGPAAGPTANFDATPDQDAGFSLGVAAAPPVATAPDETAPTEVEIAQSFADRFRDLFAPSLFGAPAAPPAAPPETPAPGGLRCPDGTVLAGATVTQKDIAQGPTGGFKSGVFGEFGRDTRETTTTIECKVP